jgi:hypothetical protein
MVAQDTLELVQTCIPGFATAPSSIAPIGIPRNSGRPAGSYQSGEPHAEQNTLSPPPESNLVTFGTGGEMLS